jgi:energy-coupling factor transporter ATP-binding protein EcfA2
LTLSEFLSTFLGRLQERGIDYCILRNHEGLPDRNTGNDLDVLLSREDLHEAACCLGSLEDVSITGRVEHSGVVNFFLAGVEWEGGQALQVDLVHSLSWKGIGYADVSGLLARSGPAQDRPKHVRIPDPVDEAIVSFLSSFLVGGFVKEKYQEFVKRTVTAEQTMVRTRFAATFGAKCAEALTNAIVADDRRGLLRLLPGLRRAVLLRELRCSPVRAMVALGRHHAREAVIRHGPETLVRVAIFGPDGSGKSTLVESLRGRLAHAAKPVVVNHLKPQILIPRKASSGPVTDPHGKPPRSSAISAAKVLVWAAELWIDRIFRRHDPIGGPRWLARLLGHLIPTPDLFIFLDAPADVTRRRKREVSEEETERQRRAYRALAETLSRAVVVDAATRPDEVAERVARAIVSRMAERLPEVA